MPAGSGNYISHSRGEMYNGHGRLCVCLSIAAFPHYCTDPDVTWGNVRVCPPVVHYWVDLQSVRRFRCYDNIAPNVKCQRVLVSALCLVPLVNISRSRVGDGIKTATLFPQESGGG